MPCVLRFSQIMLEVGVMNGSNKHRIFIQEICVQSLVKPKVNTDLFLLTYFTYIMFIHYIIYVNNLIVTKTLLYS